MEVAPYGHRPNYGGARAPDCRKLLPPSPGSKKYTKKLKQQTTGGRRHVGSAGGLLGLTEVTPHALLFVLAGRQHRVAFDGQNALWGMKYTLKTIKQQSTTGGRRGGATGGQSKAY